MNAAAGYRCHGMASGLLKNSGHCIFWGGHDFEPALSCRSPERSRRGSRRVPSSTFSFCHSLRASRLVMNPDGAAM